MDVNTRINLLYQQYQADYDVAKEAQRRGNIEGARKLYRSAAKALVEIALLESGATQQNRLMQAEHIKSIADNLGKPPEPIPSAAANTPGQPAAQKDNPGTGDDNPWESEGIPDTTFDDVVGMEDVKQLIRTHVIDQIKDPELYKTYGLDGGLGVLLYGLPGTGKTTIARAISHEINAPMYVVGLSDVLSKWVGESERLISQLFDKARESEVSVILFDDVDALGSERKDDGNHNNKIIVELINQMDGFRKNTNTIVLLASSNRPWMIDPALMRHGRFGHHLYVPLPNREARILLVRKKLGNVPVDPAMDFGMVSDLLKGYNGADISAVVNSAKVAAVQRTKALKAQGINQLSPVGYADFVNVTATYKSSVNANDVARLKDYARKQGLTLPEEM